MSGGLGAGLVLGWLAGHPSSQASAVAVAVAAFTVAALTLVGPAAALVGIGALLASANLHRSWLRRLKRRAREGQR